MTSSNFGGTLRGTACERRRTWGVAVERTDRIAELRQRISRLNTEIAAQQSELRRAVMELNELLEEQRHIARRARQQERAARWRHPEPEAEPQRRDP